MTNDEGFSILEMTAAMAIMLLATAGVFALMLPSRGSLAAQSEIADMQQRLRVAADAISREALAAGVAAGDRAPILPYRAGALRPDAPGTFKTDTITVLSAQARGGTASATYWQQNDAASGTFQLMFYDGSAVGDDVPVVDNVVGLAFEYFGDPQPPTSVEPLAEANCLFEAGDPPVPRLAVLAGGPSLVKLTAARLNDGPWCPDEAAPDRWDADLVRIRRVAVTLRVQSAVASLRGPAGVLFAHGGTSRGGHAWAPDIEVQFDISPRNLNLGR